jgi:hypothetical protein
VPCNSISRIALALRASRMPCYPPFSFPYCIFAAPNVQDAASVTVLQRELHVQGTPTLVGTAVSNDQHGFIRVPLVNSRLVLPDLRVTDSSEAMLSGRKPPLRLMMRAVYKDTLLPVPHIRHAISEGFVVAVCSSAADPDNTPHANTRAFVFYTGYCCCLQLIENVFYTGYCCCLQLIENKLR